jgi:hypothetical protein
MQRVNTTTDVIVFLQERLIALLVAEPLFEVALHHFADILLNFLPACKEELIPFFADFVELNAQQIAETSRAALPTGDLLSSEQHTLTNLFASLIFREWLQSATE